MSSDVFISYSSTDKEIAEEICKSLESQSISCWMAPRDITSGTEWAESIVNAINTCKVFVLVLSSDSNSSPHVVREVGRAANRGIPILPVIVENVTISKSLDYFISGHQWFEAVTPPLSQHLPLLTQTVKNLLVGDSLQTKTTTQNVQRKKRQSRRVWLWLLVPVLILALFIIPAMCGISLLTIFNQGTNESTSMDSNVNNIPAVPDTTQSDANKSVEITPEKLEMQPRLEFVQIPAAGTGESFDSPLIISPGTKTVVEMSGSKNTTKTVYFCATNWRPGQMISVRLRELETNKCSFSHYSLSLYNPDREKYLGGYSVNSLGYLCGQNYESMWTFIKADVEAFLGEVEGINLYSQGYLKCELEYELTEYYDAGLGTDAGSDFDHAYPINPGTCNGYLSLQASGSDKSDWYFVELKSGQTISLKLIPGVEDSIQFELYDQNRNRLIQVKPKNPGAIVNDSWTSSISQYIYIAISGTLEYTFFFSNTSDIDAVSTYELDLEIK